jgi:uncharacterized protein with NRDE domain
MCTLVIVRNGYPSYPLVVAANRDEMLDRPSEAPKLWDHAPRMLAPVDVRRGGSWIGVNEHGVFAAVTNRSDVVSVRDMDSRGDLVVMSLEARTAGEAVGRIMSLDARRYNGFHLVVADPRSGYLAYGDGVKASDARARLEDLSDGLHIVSNLGAGPAHSARADNILRVWRKARLDKGDCPHVSGFDQMLAFHDDECHVVGTGKKSMGSICIHRPLEDGYGTKSSAFIRLRADRSGQPSSWLYRHRERPKDGRGDDAGHNCDAAWQPELRLPLIQG